MNQTPEKRRELAKLIARMMEYGGFDSCVYHQEEREDGPWGMYHFGSDKDQMYKETDEAYVTVTMNDVHAFVCARRHRDVMAEMLDTEWL